MVVTRSKTEIKNGRILKRNSSMLSLQKGVDNEFEKSSKSRKTVEVPKKVTKPEPDNFLTKLYNYEPMIFKKVIDDLKFYDKLALVSSNSNFDDWLKSVGHDIRNEKPHGLGCKFLEKHPGKDMPTSIEIDIEKALKNKNELHDILSEEIYKRDDRLDIVRFLAKIEHPLLLTHGRYKNHYSRFYDHAKQTEITEKNCHELKYCRLLLEQKSKINQTDKTSIKRVTRKSIETSSKNDHDFLVVSRLLSSTTANGKTKRTNIKLFRSGILPIIRYYLSNSGLNSVSNKIDNKIESVWIITNITFEATDDWMNMMNELDLFDLMIKHIDEICIGFKLLIDSGKIYRVKEKTDEGDYLMKQLTLMDHCLGALSNSIGHNGTWRLKLIEKNYHLTVLRVVDTFYQVFLDESRAQQESKEVQNMIFCSKIKQIMNQVSWNTLNFVRQKIFENNVGREVVPATSIEIVSMFYSYILMLLEISDTKTISDALWSLVNLIRDAFNRTNSFKEFENQDLYRYILLRDVADNIAHAKEVSLIKNIQSLKKFCLKEKNFDFDKSVVCNLVRFIDPDQLLKLSRHDPLSSSPRVSFLFFESVIQPALAILGNYSCSESDFYTQVVISTGLMKFAPQILDLGSEKVKKELLLIISNVAAGTPTQLAEITQNILNHIITSMHQEICQLNFSIMSNSTTKATGVICGESLWTILNILCVFDTGHNLYKTSEKFRYLNMLLNSATLKQGSWPGWYGSSVFLSTRRVGVKFIDVLVSCFDNKIIYESTKAQQILDIFEKLIRILDRAKQENEFNGRSGMKILMKLENDLKESDFVKVITQFAIMQTDDTALRALQLRSIDIRLNYVRGAANPLTNFI